MTVAGMAAIIRLSVSKQEVFLPLYEYECKKCGKRVEKIQKFSDLPLTKCEACGGKLERLLSSSSIHFKGSGWYVTDYARKSASSASAKTEGSTDGGGKKEAESTSKKEAESVPKKETSKTTASKQ